MWIAIQRDKDGKNRVNRGDKNGERREKDGGLKMNKQVREEREQ